MFFRFRKHLEAQLLREEALFKLALLDKDKHIALLERELVVAQTEATRLKAVLLPSAYGAPRAPRPTRGNGATTSVGETSWLVYLKQHIAEIDKLEVQAKAQADAASKQESTNASS